MVSDRGGGRFTSLGTPGGGLVVGRYTALMDSVSLGTAREIMHEWTAGQGLRVHMEAVSACMAAYARILDPAGQERWAVAGLLHDFDYEKHPSPEEHPVVGVRHLRTLGASEDILRAILAHAPRTNTPRDTPMATALFACDELAGFIVACSKVRPDGMASLSAASVRKKLKDKAFAAAVSRADISQGAAELAALMGDASNPEFEARHLQRCIDAIREAGVAV